MPIEQSEAALRIAGDLFVLAILAFLIERGLAIIFEHDWYIATLEKVGGLKTIIAYIVSFAICWYYDFDLIATLLEPQSVTLLGIVITAGILAGGSAGAVKLMQDTLGLGRKSRADFARLRGLQVKAEEAKLKHHIANPPSP